MFNIESSMIDSLSLSIPSPNKEGHFVSVSIAKTSKSRKLTLVKSSELKEMECGRVDKISTYCSSIAIDAEYSDNNYVVINDNKDVVGKYVIYCGPSALRSYVTQNGKVLHIRSPLFYYEHNYGKDVKSENHFQSNMIQNQCYFDTFESALSFIQGLANNKESELFIKC